MKMICSLVITATLVYLSSCKTYFIPVESFNEQFANLDSFGFKDVVTKGPLGDKVKYKTYAMDFISCKDNKGQPVHLQMKPSLEIRFTDSANKKTIMYLDLMRVNDGFITGSVSRIISDLRKTISLRSVKKIEVQDGKKNYHYIK